MGKLSDFLSGTKILEEAKSKYNGKITVVKSLAFGTYFQVGGLTQSGGIIKDIWNHSLRKISGDKKNKVRILVLGLGGGSIIEVVRKYWPNSKVTAVDIDPVIVDLGKRYLNLDSKYIDIVIKDAQDFLIKKGSNKKAEKYDLVCVDLYVGDKYPEKFESEKFIESLKSVLSEEGIVVINRLYYGEKRPQSVKFGLKLEKIFPKVAVTYPEANMMYICKN